MEVAIQRAVTPPRPTHVGGCGSCGGYDGASALSWLSHGSTPIEWSAVGHATAVGLDALAVSPVQPSWDGPREEGGTVRPPAGLGRWRARGDHLPAPRAPARRLRPRPATRGPAPQPRQDNRPPPEVPGRARGGAPRTRRAGTPYRPPQRGSLGGSLPPRVCHSRLCARLLLDSRVVDLPRSSNLIVVTLSSLKPLYLLYPPLLPLLASRNLLVYQSLPTNIPGWHAMVRRRKDDTCVGTAARGIVA
jgi:hypothetical protein